MPSNKKPNFIIIVADDLGFTDTSAFGGEINTPNLQKLADNGLRFTDFHTASACSPTRSMLLSGTDNHIAGLGQMAEFIRHVPESFKNKPGYEGYLNYRVAALSELLKENDYSTFLSGKWHLGLTPEYWPTKRGFDKTFSLLPGAGNHFKYFPKDKETGKDLTFQTPLYESNGRKVDADTELPDDYYSTKYFTDKFIQFLKESKEDQETKDKPFFGLLTYTAPHWPYQAPEAVINKYKGLYDDGPAKLRERRLSNALKLGIIPEGVEPHKVETFKDKEWKDLTIAEKKIESKIMEVYAAMVDIMDENIGRVIKTLKDLDEYDDTFIVFMSDNGAEGMMLEAMSVTSVKIQSIVKEYFNNSYENIGKKDSFLWYSDQWAQAATAPHYMYKMWASEGGIRCPLIVSYPRLIPKADNGKIKRGFTTVMDILPTVLDIADVKHPFPNKFNGRDIVKPRGSSWLKYLKGESDYVHDDEKVTGWELFAQQAIRKGKYKALFIPKPLGPDRWQLFDLALDPGETTDLSEKHPDTLQLLIDHWSEYVAETGLVEITDIFHPIMKTEYNRKILY